MRVKMNTTACGPTGNLYADRVYELAEDEAKALVRGGYAARVDEPATEITQGPGEHEAEVDDGKEDQSDGRERETASRHKRR